MFPGGPLDSSLKRNRLEIRPRIYPGGRNIFCIYTSTVYTQSADRTVSSFVDSSAQHRGNEAEPDSNGNKNFQSGPNVPCQSAQTDKSVSSA